MKQKITPITLDDMLTIAENLGWEFNEENFDNDRKGYDFSAISPVGQDFHAILETGDETNWLEPQRLIDALRDYIRGFVPYDEAQLWIRDGKGQNGAPEDPMDVIADMQACKEAMQKLLDAWTEGETESCVASRTIRIHITYPTGMDEREVIEAAVAKVLADARAHTHTVENGVKIDFIEDCGDPQ